MKKTVISGFPEWLPNEQLIEEWIVDFLQDRFSLAGFTPLRSRSVEPLEVLAKGEIDKEIYVLNRLISNANGSETHAEFGLHFDLTVPFARFVSERVHELAFPFKRYQIQSVWRGERPQEGRYREFIQADVDVVAQNNLSFEHDVDLICLLLETLEALPIPTVTVGLSSRKLINAACALLEIEDVQDTIRKIDKLAKLGEAKVEVLLRDKLSPGQSKAMLEFSKIRSFEIDFVDRLKHLGFSSSDIDSASEELIRIVKAAERIAKGRVCVDLRIARGFDYYTGVVFEGTMKGFEHIGAVCSGGRYDNLVGKGSIGKALPGVGFSIGITRILGVLFKAKMLTMSRDTPTCVLIAINSEAHREKANEIGQGLRRRGIATEVFDNIQDYGKQIRYAKKKTIPYVWFHDVDGTGRHEVRDLVLGIQNEANVDSWVPEPDYLKPTIKFNEKQIQ